MVGASVFHSEEPPCPRKLHLLRCGAGEIELCRRGRSLSLSRFREWWCSMSSTAFSCDPASERLARSDVRVDAPVLEAVERFCMLARNTSRATLIRDT
jgi:hypothetical protein